MGLQLQVKSFKPIAASTTSVAGAQTLGGAGNMTLAGTASTFNGTNTASLVTFTSTGNISGVTFTVTGTDVNGDAQTEAVTGPNNTTVFSSKFFLTVTQIAASGAVGTNTSAGNSHHCLGAIFSGANRVKGFNATSGGTANAEIKFRETSGAGTVKFFYSSATATQDYLEPYIPDEGVLFRNGSYIEMLSGSVATATVYYG
tara:strand:- start:2099 stop:2701 length:603 start_codon:yes stop_codon:yes gene_type:complete